MDDDLYALESDVEDSMGGYVPNYGGGYSAPSLHAGSSPANGLSNAIANHAATFEVDPSEDPGFDLSEVFEDEEADLVHSDEAPDLMVCPDCGTGLEAEDEPINVLTFPLQWRWTCPDCGHAEIQSEEPYIDQA